MGRMPRVYRWRKSRAMAKCRENLAAASVASNRLTSFSGDLGNRWSHPRVRKTLDWSRKTAILALGSEEC